MPNSLHLSYLLLRCDVNVRGRGKRVSRFLPSPSGFSWPGRRIYRGIGRDGLNSSNPKNQILSQPA